MPATAAQQQQQEQPTQAEPAPERPSLSVNVAGHSIAMRNAFAAGDVIDAAAALELNRVLADRLRSMLRKAAAQPGISRQELQALADAFRLTGTSVKMPPDPTAQTALDIARGALRAQLAQNGQTAEQLGRQKFEQLVRELAQDETILGEARRRVLAAQAVVLQGLGPDFGEENVP